MSTLSLETAVINVISIFAIVLLPSECSGQFSYDQILT